MDLITQEQLVAHCKADDEDLPLLIDKGNAAEAYARSYCNRDIYPDATALADALAGMSQKCRDAVTARDAAIEAANEETNADVKAFLLESASTQYRLTMCAIKRTGYGIVVNDDIRSAILLHASHLYRNRDGVEAGQGASAVEVPMTTLNILFKWRIPEEF